MNITPIRAPWGGTMTGRERFNRQMNYQSVDRSFNMEFGYWEENFTEWDIFRDNGIRDNAQADRFFSFDRIEGTGPSFGGWMHPSFERRVVERRGDYNILMNGDGLLAEVPADGHDTIPHYLKSSIVTPDDWKRCKEERFRRDDPERRIDVQALRQRHPDDRDYPLGVNCGSMIGKIRDMLTFEGLAYAMFDYPEMVEDMVETCCLLVEDALDQLLPAIRFDYASGWEDICFKNGPIVSVDFFRDIVMPRYKRIRRKLDQHGVGLWYTDCDGDVRPILPYLMEGGINCDTAKFDEGVAKGATVVACSSLLTTTMPYMRDVVEHFKGRGVKVIIGGAPITQAYADEIGAFGYSEDANGAVKLADAIFGRK